MASTDTTSREALINEKESESLVPRLTDDLELIGAYPDSGLKEPPYIVRRGDGQVIQLSRLLFLIASCADGRRTASEIAEEVSAEYGRAVSEDNVLYLIDHRLGPLGVIITSETNPPMRSASPVLSLKFRARLLSERLVWLVTTVFYPLFLPFVVGAVVVSFAALDAWLFFNHGLAEPVHETIYQPHLVLLSFALIVVSAVFHEFGHATACRYGGAKPGAIGVGLYLVWPAFYTNVTDAYRLGRGGRLRTDLGGVYFNAIFCLVIAGAYFATGVEALLVVIAVQHLEMLHQFLPFLRLDGYYVVADLTGVPDLFARIGPILRSLNPFKESDPRANELKPWARAVVTLWVLSTIPFLGLVFTMMVLVAPRLFSTAWDSVSVRFGDALLAFRSGEVDLGATHLLEIFALILPAAGIAIMMARATGRVSAATWKWSGQSPLHRAPVMVIFGAAGALLVTWWPNGEYKPIARGEAWTLQEGALALSQIPSGDPSAIFIDEAAPQSGAIADKTTTAASGDPPTSEDGPAPAGDRTRAPAGQASPDSRASGAPQPTTTPSPTPTSTPSSSPSPSPSGSPEASPSPTESEV